MWYREERHLFRGAVPNTRAFGFNCKSAVELVQFACNSIIGMRLKRNKLLNDVRGPTVPSPFEVGDGLHHIRDVRLI